MKSLILIAPPAAGKGTISDKLKEKYSLPHISTGDLLRNEVKKGSEFGEQISAIMESGGLVSDDIINRLLTERLSLDDCNDGYILDGYPRNVEQAKAYEKILESLGKEQGLVVFLNVDKDVALKRITGRVSCSSCGKVYNIYNPEMAPKEEMICDICGNALSRRKDDNAETFQKRFDTYVEQTEPLLEYYENLGNLMKVDSTDSSQALIIIEDKLLG